MPGTIHATSRSRTARPTARPTAGGWPSIPKSHSSAPSSAPTAAGTGGERRGAERDGDERPLERRHAAAEEHERVGAREGRRGPHLERPVDGDGGDRRRTADAAAREEQRAQRLAAQLAARDERGEALARGAVADQRGEARPRAQAREQDLPAPRG